VRDLDVFRAEENLLNHLSVRAGILLDFGVNNLDEVMNRISNILGTHLAYCRVFKPNEIIAMANAFDQFY
jgi:hypothetical protein